MEYTDKVLIKLKRQYTKDETVSALITKLKQIEFKNGELQSLIDEKIWVYKKNELQKIKDLEFKLEDIVKENMNLKSKIRKLNERPPTKTPEHIKRQINDFKKEIKRLKAYNNNLRNILKK